MVKHTIKQDRNTTWTIDGDNEVWTLKTKAEISTFGTAIDVLATSEGNDLHLLGDVKANGALSRGVQVLGDDTTIFIGEKSTIQARSGIWNSAEGLTIQNEGEIDGGFRGIDTSEAALIRNAGTISGRIGIEAVGSSRIVNRSNGEISGETSAIDIVSGYNATIVNRGLISGDDAAITISGIGSNLVKNFGTIVGDIVGGNGFDIIDTRKGTVEGALRGGGAADVYRIADSDTTIVELAGNGNDRVESWASYALAANLEDLILKGKGDFSGLGNGEDNVIYGNKGDNTLTGGGGDDVINGWHGDDMMNGGAGDDTFVFQRDGDHDRISGFEHGADKITMIFDGFNEFADIQDRISQHGDDVWISMGQGDRLILLDTDIADVDASDFNFEYTSSA